jgi:uncharacterized protein (TIGR02145 family)
MGWLGLAVALAVCATIACGGGGSGDGPAPTDEPATLAVTTLAPTSVAETSMIGRGKVTVGAGGTVYEVGICLESACHAAGAPGADGTFQYAFTSLTPDTAYTLTAFVKATADGARVYGNAVAARTAAQPGTPTLTVTTLTPTVVRSTSLTGNGSATAEAGVEIVETGLCWSASADGSSPTCNAATPSKEGLLEYNFTGLTAGTNYWVAAYAKAKAQSAPQYGGWVAVSTLGADDKIPPDVGAMDIQFYEPRYLVFWPRNRTSPYSWAKDVGETSKAKVLEFGYCWRLIEDKYAGESGSYDPDYCQAEDEGGDHSLNVRDGLKPGASLQAWTYAYLGKDKAGKDQYVFGPGIAAPYYPISESPQVSEPDAKDAIFTGYRTVLLAGHWWMAENVKATVTDGYALLPSKKLVPCVNDAAMWTQLQAGAPAAYCGASGLLLNATAALQACPEGWRLPTKAEAASLLAYYADKTELFCAAWRSDSKDGASQFHMSPSGLRRSDAMVFDGKSESDGYFSMWLDPNDRSFLTSFQTQTGRVVLTETLGPGGYDPPDRVGLGVRCVTQSSLEP